MRSSISDSKSTALAYAKVLVGICAILMIAIEISSIYLLKYHSLTYARVSRQYDEAVKTRPAGPGEPVCVLMVGNSLLLHGVELNRLQALTSASMRIHPIFLEATGYYDWLYGLRRLFRQGARPQVVVVGVGVNYFLENGVRQDYAPMLFFDARDTLAVASDLHLDRTATSNLLLAHSSTFWDTRSAIRTQILRNVVPHVEDLFLLVNPRPAIPEGREFEEISIPRLRTLRELCETHGAKLILLVPPTLSSESAVNQMAYAAHTAGVEISIPIDPTALSAKFYQPDGMHLNSEGAVLFTSALAKDLPERVQTNDTLASR
jgi:lysophospholipase L1-like esterase/flagellar biogenesis protein FliO